jgi:hypothetical protein
MFAFVDRNEEEVCRMKKQIVVWLLRRLVSAAGSRGPRSGRTGRAGVPSLAAVLFAARRLEVLLARVWPWLDTPANRERVARFVARMRSSATQKA